MIATGYCDRPHVPAARAASCRLASSQIVPTDTGSPDQLPPGGVLVVGASATGVQLADEIHASGRAVTLAVGRHMRLPRTYRGRDIMWWLDAMGILDDTSDDVFDIKTSRESAVVPTGGPSRHALARPEAPSASRRPGARPARPRRSAIAAYFDDDLIATTAASDAKLAELLARIDAFIAKAGLPVAAPPEPFEPTWTSALGVTKTTIDLRAAGIDTVIWATGFIRRYPWLHVPVLDQRGEIVHRDGITPVPGLFVLGLHFQRRRNSAFIDGVGDDAAFLADLIAGRAPSLARAANRARKKTPWPMRLTG